MKVSARERADLAVMNVALTLVSLLFLVPFYITFINAFKLRKISLPLRWPSHFPD